MKFLENIKEAGAFGIGILAFLLLVVILALVWTLAGQCEPSVGWTVVGVFGAFFVACLLWFGGVFDKKDK